MADPRPDPVERPDPADRPDPVEHPDPADRSDPIPRRSGSVLWWLVAGVVIAVIVGFGAELGLWFLPFVAGVAAGLTPHWRPRSALGLAILAVATGWGAVLWWGALSGAPVGITARIIAALAGLPPHAAVGVAATLAVGLLQVLAAFWLTRAVTKSVARNPDPTPSPDGPQTLGPTRPANSDGRL